MAFQPEDLQRCQTPLPQSAPRGYEAYGREGLKIAAPEDDKAGYMAAADRWVIESGGRIWGYGDSFEGTHYLVPPGLVRP
jgi:hypothetical protein